MNDNDVGRAEDHAGVQKKCAGWPGVPLDILYTGHQEWI
jgi:hypothetical protein